MDALPEIAELVPHEPPMRLLDRILRSDDSSIRCALTVRVSSPFERGGTVRAVVALEYMAQAAAVWTGLMARLHGEGPRPGYLVHVREMLLETDRFATGDALWVEVAHTGGDSDLGSFEGTVSAAGGDTPLVRATFSVYRGVPEGT